ncbi:hypothetical protein QBC34DRAFT_453209 [Podospora aff. communis PSN243]|uniref:Prion-inhibition and propagation HeLo domain-containing protein n=1 Tax=Podospora aff. communis PSN243 TaxID=3040156 RepID=A0AAV9G506_9PEZI|nr:hypothetical protein QBC34DRAFT_453209 [Podospora aff. communis PSN243]
MEPVSLALGIIPVLGGSVKIYKSTHSKLKNFRHYSREVDRVRKLFDRQKHFFRSFGITRRASQALYDALWAAWSTQDAARFQHVVRLFLETKADQGVQLNLVISCLGRNLVQQSMIKIHVKSQSLDWMAGSISAAPDQALCREPKRRLTTTTTSLSVPSLPTSTPDLRTNQHFCSALTPKPSHHHHHHQPPALSRTRCVGFLDTSSHDRFRHEFFNCCESVCWTLKRLDQVLSEPRSDELSIQHQLQLALSIASAVLKFNSTPWLGEYWSLQDLHFFERDSDLPTSLQTVHVGTECKKIASANAALMELDVSDALEDAKLIHGIQNPIMYNLGVALLSIGRWNLVDPHDVLKARRIASQTCPLGPRYQELTRKVLDCDFGYGKDLRRPKLQEAVYDGVLLELEFMISALSLDEDPGL